MAAMKMMLRLSLLALAFAVTPARADPAASDHVPSDVSVLAYGAAHPECLEWTDACRTCMRSPDGGVGCSTPGIACVQKEIVCKKQASSK
jgi:hypothetical protein